MGSGLIGGWWSGTTPENTNIGGDREARIATPYAITRRDDGILIEWDAGGHQGVFPARELRLACRCAACVEEMTGRPLLDPAAVPEDIRPVQVALVGAYGLRILWSDGHGTGIYTFDLLRRACPCPACSGSRRA